MPTNKGKERRFTATPESVDVFLKHLNENGAKPGTIHTYQAYLRSLLDFLPEGKQMTKDTLLEWRDAMRRENVADVRIRSRISSANKYLEFYSLPDFCLRSGRRRIPENALAEMSREEYLCLLRAAWRGGKVRNYLIMKTLCAMGIGVNDLAGITMDQVKAGTMEAGTGTDRRFVTFPMSLRREMRDYAETKHLADNAMLLVSRDGSPPTNRTISRMMRYLAERTGVRKEIATPRHLQSLYRRTHREIQKLVNAQIEQIYNNLLESELLSITSG